MLVYLGQELNKNCFPRSKKGMIPVRGQTVTLLTRPLEPDWTLIGAVSLKQRLRTNESNGILRTPCLFADHMDCSDFAVSLSALRANEFHRRHLFRGIHVSVRLRSHPDVILMSHFCATPNL